MVAQPDVAAPVTAQLPSRFRGAPERAARLARPLGLLGRVRHVDGALVERLGRRMLARDELGADLAAAMSRPRGDGERVTMRQVEAAVEHGVDDGSPPALRRFVAAVEATPEWVDMARLERGARALRRMGPTLDDVLLALSLIGGYRFAGPADLLVATGGLTGSTAMRRLGETRTWAHGVISPGGMARDGAGWRLTVHVRAMHALVNHRFERDGRWDVARFGLPINQTDQAGTLGLFASVALLGTRALGWVVTPEESRSVMHLWRYVGWLMGVDEEWLFSREREQNAFMHHLVAVQDDVTPAGPALAGALVEGQRTLGRGRFAVAAGRWRRRRLLSILRWFLGAEGLRDLGLPVGTVWAVPTIVLRNVVLSGVVARTRAGRRFLERRGDRHRLDELARTFGAARPQVGALPPP